jgi:hypothetical protein
LRDLSWSKPRPLIGKLFRTNTDLQNDSLHLSCGTALTQSFHYRNSLTTELAEAKKKMKDKSVEKDKKTFLKAQMPKMETEIASLKEGINDLLEQDELDPRGEFYVLAKKLVD